MKINKIKINNFKSIYDEFEIDFDKLNGFWKISGPVGSGKTTIGEAIIFGLFGTVNGKNNGDLISWGQKHGLVELWCESKNSNIYIKRELNAYGQSPVYVEVDGEEMIFANKRDAQIKLESEYYDTSKMILELLCIISFNNFKSLASLNTSDTKKFLDQVLGFQILSEYADTCKELKQENLELIQKCKNSINLFQAQIEQFNKLLSEEKIEGDMDNIKNILTNLKQKQKELTSINTNKLSELNNKIIKLKQDLSTIITLGKNKAKEIEFIERGICPTCGAEIDKSHLSEKKEEREVLAKQYKYINDDILSAEGEYKNIQVNYNQEAQDLNNEIRKNEVFLIKLEEQAKRSNINIKQINELETKINDLNQEYSKLSSEDAQWTELYNILSSDVRSKILGSFIPILNDNIQKYSQLLQLPYNIIFDNSFKCNIELFGINDKIPITSLSTGQLKIVDMVIILGILGTVLGSNGINIIFLDELFSNLDEDLRENMCSILKATISQDKCVFIISHQDINSQLFNGVFDLKLERCNVAQKTKINIIKYEH